MFFFLAILQQEGAIGMTFGTQAECVEVRAKAATNAQVLFLSDCQELKMIPVEPKR